MSVEARLEKLERENRMMKRVVMTALCAVCAVCAVAQTTIETDGDVQAQGFIGDGSQLTAVDADLLDSMDSAEFAKEADLQTVATILAAVAPPRYVFLGITNPASPDLGFIVFLACARLSSGWEHECVRAGRLWERWLSLSRPTTLPAKGGSSSFRSLRTRKARIPLSTWTLQATGPIRLTVASGKQPRLVNTE